MRLAENTWKIGGKVLTFHGLWRRSKKPEVKFMYVENGEMKSKNIHFSHINSAIDTDWMKRDELTETEKERLLSMRNTLKD
jgi:hypothetical protein